MNNFSVILNEVRKNFNSESLLQSEITSFINKVNKAIPSVVKDVIYLTKKYNLLDKASIEEIRLASKSSLQRLADKYNINIDEIESLWKSLKDLKSNIHLLPQYMSSKEREELEAGKLTMDDLTIDLESSAGRNVATKMYMPMILKIVNQHIGKSKLSKSDLISVALEGFTLAMNDWDRSKGVPFKTYAGTRVRQLILNEINDNGHSLSGFNSYAHSKGYKADALSLDQLISGDAEFRQDRLAALVNTDDEGSVVDDHDMETIYDMMEKKFSQRDCIIFYRFFGVNGYKKEKSKDLAKEFGWSEANIRNSVINKILKYFRTDKNAQRILGDLFESYSISLMTSLVGMDRSVIMETLCNDDVFILLEELNKWADPDSFKLALAEALDHMSDQDQKYIITVLGKDFDFLDGSFKKYKKVIILFLNNMYPTEPMTRKTDVSLIDYMLEIQEAYKKHCK